MQRQLFYERLLDMAKLINKTQSDFTIVSNIILKSDALKFEEKGLYVYLLSKPDYWNFSADRIANESKEQISSVKRILKSLEDIGLLKRFKIKDDKGFFVGVDYHILDKINPSVENPTMEFADDGLSNDGKPTDGISGGGNPTNISNTVYNNTDNSNIDNSNTEEQTKKIGEEQIQDDLKTEKSKRKKVAPKKEKVIPTLNEFLTYGHELITKNNLGNPESYNYSITSKYEQWIENDWKDGNDMPINSWRSKLKNTLPYLKPLIRNGTEQQPQQERFAGRQSREQVNDAIQRELTNSYDPRNRE